MKKQIIAGCIALAAGVAAVPASAASYGVSSDGYSYQFIPFATGSTSTSLYIFNGNGTSANGHSFAAVLDFNTLDSALSSLVAGSFTATLNMHVNCTPGGFGNVCPSQGTVTADILTVSPASSVFTNPTGGTNHGSFSVSIDNGWVSTDVTSLVEYWASNGSTGNGIVLSAMAYPAVTDSSGTVVAIILDSLEVANGAYAAYIDIQAAPVPLPAALPLFAAGLGVLGWAARRRQKQAAA